MRRASCISANRATSAPRGRARLAALLLFAALHAGSAGAVPLAPGVRVLSASRGGESPASTLDALERAGYRVHVALLPEMHCTGKLSKAASIASRFFMTTAI